MAFFSNRTINYLNLHLALVNLLDQAYLVFSPIFLYERGFSIPSIFVLLAALNFLRMPLRFLSFPVLRRSGLKAALMIGVAGYGLSFPVLGMVKGWDGWLLSYVLLSSCANGMHWLCFHTYYTLAGEHEKRGRQVAVAYALMAGFAALAPVLGAFTIAREGFGRYFMLAVVLTVLMLLVLSRCRDIVLPPIRWREGRKVAFNLATKIHLMESSAVYPMNICWLFVVYLYVGKILSLGSIIAFGVVVQMAYQLFLGVWVDRGRGTLITHAAISLRMLTAVGRALLPLRLFSILGLEAMGGIGAVHYSAVQPTVLYNVGKQSPHPLWYWFFAEAAFDIGTVIGAGGAALLLWCGVELRHVILLALPFLSVLWWLLYDYYRRHPHVHPQA